MLDEALAAFAAAHRPFRAPPLRLALRLAAFDGVLALVLAEASDAMQALEDDTIRAFRRFRAPPNAAERARNTEDAPLTPRQEELFHECPTCWTRSAST